jgi:hypothetical protein
MSLTNLFSELKRRLDDDGIPSTARSAILWGREDLLGTAVESLLHSAYGWQVIKLLGNQDAGLLAREVEKVKPRIIFINKGDCTEEYPPPLHLILDFPELKIVIINPENNLVEVYKRENIHIKEASDLLSIIESNLDSGLEGGDIESLTRSA